MSGELILCVEDDGQQMEAMRILLEHHGYRVLRAQDGVEAVELYHRLKSEIALVILDTRMPKLNGWEAFQEMKKENPDLKVLFATAYAIPQVRSALTRGELHGLFIKPYPIDDFLARVSELTRSAVD
jgi:two-component system, cell cycle sensor histidine kinase and response regulator CckA